MNHSPKAVEKLATISLVCRSRFSSFLPRAEVTVRGDSASRLNKTSASRRTWTRIRVLYKQYYSLRVDRPILTLRGLHFCAEFEKERGPMVNHYSVPQPVYPCYKPYTISSCFLSLSVVCC